MTTLYEDLKAAGVPLDSHESDLYAKVTPASHEIVKRYQKAEPQHYGCIQTFVSNIDGKVWYDRPFAYLPLWEAKVR